jgi:hypothetical protein
MNEAFTTNASDNQQNRVFSAMNCRILPRLPAVTMLSWKSITAELGRCTLAFLLVAFLTLSPVQSQTVGVDICACQPSVYTFRLNFTLVCSQRNVEGPGIKETDCITEPVGVELQNVTDEVFVAVTRIEILELDQTLLPVAQTQVTGDFRDGDTFTYTSIIATEVDGINGTSIPRGFQLNLNGRNADEVAIVNTWTIVYQNDCGIFPILFEETFIGITVFVRTLAR